MQTHPDKKRNINISGLLQSSWRGFTLKNRGQPSFKTSKPAIFPLFFCLVDTVVLKAKHTFGFEGNKKSCLCNFHSADASSPRWSSDGISESLQFHSDSFYFIIFLFFNKVPFMEPWNIFNCVSPLETWWVRWPSFAPVRPSDGCGSDVSARCFFFFFKFADRQPLRFSWLPHSENLPTRNLMLNFQVKVKTDSGSVKKWRGKKSEKPRISSFFSNF